MAPRKKKETVEIWCGVLKDGSVFPVEIASDATVAKLCAKMFKEQRFEDRFSFPASASIKRFVPEDAQVGNEDLKSVSKRTTLLKKGEVPDTGFKELRPTWKLNSANCFGPTFPVKDEEIHVLAKIPDEGPPTKRQRTDEVLSDMAQKLGRLCELLQPKTEQFSLSSLSSGKWKILQEKLGIDILDVRREPASDLSPIDGFQWESVRDALGNFVLDESNRRIPLTEDQQRSAYNAYVHANLVDVLKDEFLVHGADYTHTLDVDIPGHNIELVGMADTLIVKKGGAPLVTRANMLIEVKNVAKESIYQAATELIALDLSVEHPVMALLTDLVDHWQFFWISAKCQSTIRIKTLLVTTPTEGFAFAKAWINHASASADADTNAEEAFSMPFVMQPVVQRKLRNLLSSIREEDEGDDIRESLEQYFAIAAELGPDVEMARAVARRMVQSMPTFNGWT